MEQGRTSEPGKDAPARQDAAQDDMPVRSGRGAESALAALKTREERRNRLRVAPERDDSPGRASA